MHLTRKTPFIKGGKWHLEGWPKSNKLAVLLPRVSFRKVRKADGLKLSSEYGTLFGEVSAADGRNVEGNLLQMAKLLREKQDLDIQRSVSLLHEAKAKKEQQATKKKKFGCC